MFHPLFIDLKGKKILIIGAGSVGTKRALALLKHGAEVTVVSKTFSKKIEGSKAVLIKGDAVQVLPSLRGFFLVVIASDERKANQFVSRKARKEGVLVNRTDKYRKGDVVFPMTAKIKGHTMAYTTLGENPRLLKKIKKLIRDEFSKDET